MSKPIVVLSLSMLLFTACQRNAEPGTEATTAEPDASQAATPAAEPAKPTQRKLSPEEIAAIEASGKTGLWSDVTEACPTGRPQAATLIWNVKAQHDGRVVVYLLDKNEQPRNFGQSGPVGSKQTGPWLRPGMVFRVRTQEDKRDLAELVIGEKPDC